MAREGAWCKRVSLIDGLFDWPVGPDVVTAQAAFLHDDVGSPPWFGLPTAPIPMVVVTAQKISAVVFEAGYRISQLKISPSSASRTRVLLPWA